MHAGSIHAEQEHDEQLEAAVEQAHAPAAPVPLLVGAADDHAELDADRRADAALERLAPAGEQGHAHAVRRSATAPSGQIGLAGGALDGATEQRLSSRLGRGGALDASVRRRMESGFGRSFANVNVHTDGEADSLSRQMSATAFTVGTDMFFSKGAYRPGDESGDRLIAHELAHVEQDAGGAHRTVHRAVGFEFETPLIVKKQNVDGSFAKYAKGTVLKDSGGLKLTTDEHSTYGSVIEWVIDPPVQEHNRKQLVGILKQLRKATESVIGSCDRTRDDVFSQPGGKTKDSVPTIPLSGTGITGVPVDAWVLPDYVIQANPQVTGGISFDKVIDMMSEMGSGGDVSQVGAKLQPGARALQTEAVKGLTTAQAATLVKAGGAPNGLAQASKELQGLAALLVCYLKAGAVGSLLDYPKLISDSLLVRTDFGTLFTKLPQTEIAHLEQNPQDFVAWIVGLANVNPQERVIERGVRKSYDRQSPDYTTRDDDPGLQTLRSEWLTAICGGHDLMSAKTNDAMEAKFEGLGRLGDRFDAVGKESSKKATKQVKTGVIMEYRQMQKGATSNTWSDLALGIFDYIKDRNKR